MRSPAATPRPAASPAAERAPNIGVVKVPDERLDHLSELFKPKKTTPADVTYVDVAIPAGAAREGTIQPDVLAQIRNADALLHVARAFDGRRRRAPADPWRDVEELELEFTVADLTVVEKRLEKLQTSGRHGSTAEREQNAMEEALLDRLLPHLSEGKPLRSFGLDADEEHRLRGYRFLTQKPVLVVLSIDEAQLSRGGQAGGGGRAALRPAVDRRGGAGRKDRGGDRRSSPRTTRRSSWRTWASPSRRAAGSSA